MSVISKPNSEEYSVVALYGIDPAAKAAEDFYHTIVKWFTDLGYPPDKVGIKGVGHSGKVGSFVRGNAKLQRTGFEDVIMFEVVSTAPDTNIQGRNYLLTASYDGDVESLHAHFVARSSLASLSPTSMLPVVQKISNCLKPAYGIGYTREYQFGPEWYAMGTNYGPEIFTEEAYEEELNISKWGYVGMVKQVYREGLLRDVYPWNFLARPHLSRLIGKVPLEKWIGQDPGRGTLRQLGLGVCLWVVGEANIPDIRKTLREAGVLFDWRTYPGG